MGRAAMARAVIERHRTHDCVCRPSTTSTAMAAAPFKSLARQRLGGYKGGAQVRYRCLLMMRRQKSYDMM